GKQRLGENTVEREARRRSRPEPDQRANRRVRQPEHDHRLLLHADILDRNRSAAALLITLALALAIVMPAACLSGKLALEPTRGSLAQYLHPGGLAQAGNGALHASFLSQSIASMESWLEGQGLRIEDIRHWMAKASTYLSNYMTANVATLARNLLTFAV